MKRVIYRMYIVLVLLVIAVPVIAQDDRLQVVASHSILADVVSNVAGSAVDVTSTMPVGADPHSFQPTPSDLTTLAEADLVFINGAGFEEGLLEAIENAATDMTIVAVSDCVPMLSPSADMHDDHDHEGESHDDHDHEGESHDDHDHEDESHDDHDHEDESHDDHDYEDEAHDDHDHEGEAHDDETAREHCDDYHQALHGADDTHDVMYGLACEGAAHDHDDHDDGDDAHDHDHGNCDPHVWMLPENVMVWTLAIRDALTELDPSNADLYAANADEYIATLSALSDDFIAPMIDTLAVDDRILVTSHDTLSYLAAAYDFEIVGTIIPSASTVSDPSTREVARLIDTITQAGVPAIFAETTVSDSLATTIANETGAELVTLYSGSLSPADEPASTYVDYIRYNYDTIVTALGGGM